MGGGWLWCCTGCGTAVVGAPVGSCVGVGRCRGVEGPPYGTTACVPIACRSVPACVVTGLMCWTDVTVRCLASRVQGRACSPTRAPLHRLHVGRRTGGWAGSMGGARAGCPHYRLRTPWPRVRCGVCRRLVLCGGIGGVRQYASNGTDARASLGRLGWGVVDALERARFEAGRWVVWG